MFQMGPEAWSKFLQACLVGASSDERRCAILLVDLFVHTGDLARGFVDVFNGFGTPVYYKGFCACDVSLEWAEDLLLRHVRHAFLQGALNIAGHSPLPPELPADQAEAVPTKPSLNICVWTDTLYKARRPSVCQTESWQSGMTMQYSEKSFKPGMAPRTSKRCSI